MEFSFILQKDNLIDYQLSMANRDSKLKKTKAKIHISILLFTIILFIFFKDLKIESVIILLVLNIVLYFLFSKYYWWIIQRHIVKAIDKKEISFENVHLYMNNNSLELKTKEFERYINYDSISNIFTTNTNIVIQYLFQNQVENIIVPTSVIGAQYNEFMNLIEKGKNSNDNRPYN